MLHVGYGNVVVREKVVAIGALNNQPTKRLVEAKANEGKVINMTSGRKATTVIYTKDYLILSAANRETLTKRWEEE